MRPVVWSDEARRDYLDILRYIAKEDLAAAEKVADAFEIAGNNLGKHATGRPGRVTGTYEKSVPHVPWIIVYALTERSGQENVAILRVIHTARNWRPGQWPV